MVDTSSLDDASAQMSQTFDGLQLRARDLETGANSFARAMTTAFTKGMVEGRQFDDVLKSLTLRLSDLSVRMALQPVTRGIASGISGLFEGLFATGNGKTQAFASGGVIAAPTYFPLGQGGLGLAGEAGPEAIMPLSRGSDGRLGVSMAASAPASVTVNIQTPDAESFRRSDAYMSGLIARAVSRGQRSL